LEIAMLLPPDTMNRRIAPHTDDMDREHLKIWERIQEKTKTSTPLSEEDVDDLEDLYEWYVESLA
jgi:hypothetical protein